MQVQLRAANVAPRVLLLTGPSPFQTAIARGVLDGGGRLVGIAEPCGTPLTGAQVWRRRVRRMVRNRWPPNLASRLLFACDARGSGLANLIDELKVDLMIVSRWSVLRPEIFEKPPLGTVNTHVSLLPELRGGDPIPGALLAGLRRTGVTIHFIDAGIDTGDIILQRRLPIFPQDTQEGICARAAKQIRLMYAQVIRRFRSGCVPRRRQDSSNSFYFTWRRYFGSALNEALPVDWHAPAWLIARVTRLCQCSTSWQGSRLEIVETRMTGKGRAASARPGEVIAGHDGELTVAAGEGLVDVVLGPSTAVSNHVRSASFPALLSGQTFESATWPRWREFVAWARRLPSSEKLPHSTGESTARG